MFERNDHIINPFEIKFHNQPFTVSKEYADKLRRTLWFFQQASKARKPVQWVFISTYGLTPNQHSIGLMSRVLTLDDLFG